MEYDYIFKIIVIGDSGVGKSSILLRYIDDQFESSYISTIGVDFKIKTIEVSHNGVTKIIKMQIWDTAGQERFRTITKTYYRGSNAALICYDITDPESFQHISRWVEDVDQYAIKSCVKIIVGCKSDLEEKRKVPPLAIEEYSQMTGLLHIETSAKTGSNIEQCFNQLARGLLVSNHHYKRHFHVEHGDIHIQPKSTCC